MSHMPPPSGSPAWNPYGGVPPLPPKRRKTGRRILLGMLGAVVLLFGLGIALGGGDTTPASSGADWTANAGVPALAQTTADEPTAAPANSKTSFGDGTWVVGEDIETGTYKSTGAETGIISLCSVSTYSDDAASSNAILDIQVADKPGAPVRVKLTKATKSVKASGCERFEKVA